MQNSFTSHSLRHLQVTIICSLVRLHRLPVQLVAGSDTTPPTPQDTITLDNYKWDSMIAAKRIGTTDVTFVIPRRNYANGTTYDMYEHNISSSNTTDSGATNLFDSTYYFITDEYKVYKVLDNNGGTAIAAGATGLYIY